MMAHPPPRINELWSLRPHFVQPPPIFFIQSRVPAFGRVRFAGDEDRLVLRRLLERRTVGDDEVRQFAHCQRTQLVLRLDNFSRRSA